MPAIHAEYICMKLEHVLSILVSICIALASFSLKWTFDANAKLQVIQQQIAEKSATKEHEDRQDATLKMHWKYNSFLLAKLNESRFKEGLPPLDAPRLD